MKHLIFLVTAGLFMSACSVPQVNVKQRWNQALVNYSFVPMYPARGDVDVGDIRIHTIDQSAEAFDSRLLSDWKRNKVLDTKPAYTSAVLPGMEAVRLISLDTEATGLSGLLRSLLGARIDASSSVYVSLQGLTTAEVADQDVARRFVRYIQTSAKAETDAQKNFLWGLCAAAKTFDDPQFRQIGISIVTRVIRAKEVVYYSGSGISNVEGQSQRDPAKSDVSTALDAKTNETGNSAIVRTGSSLPKADIPDGVVVGVDALMILPATVIPHVVNDCANIAPLFAKSSVSVLRGNRTSAGRQD